MQKQSAERRFISSAQMGYAGAVRYGDRTVGNGRCFDDFCLVLTLQDTHRDILPHGDWGNGGWYVFRRLCFSPDRRTERPVVRFPDGPFVLFGFDRNFFGNYAFFPWMHPKQ